jgi:hypothetical protein
VEITSATSFSITLSGNDLDAVTMMFNKAGTSSTTGTTYNLAAADGWNAAISGHDASDATNAVTVSSVPLPNLNSATYDYVNYPGILKVNGSGFLSRDGANNDIDVSKISIVGEGGNTYTLTSSSVDIIDSTNFWITLNATDQLNVAGLLNKNGTSSVSSTPYKVNGAEDWAAGADASVNVVDNTNFNITVGNVRKPTITSADYNSSTGVLTVTGTNMVAGFGSNNDITVSNLTLLGQDNTTYTLTTSNVEVTSATSFTVTLNANDQTALRTILNQNGTQSTGATTYNLAAADDWNTVITPGSGSNIQDLTGNAVTVSYEPSGWRQRCVGGRG